MGSVVLLSGGLDSAICLFRALADGETWALAVDYGQTHRCELAAARAIAGLAGVPLRETTVRIDLGASLISGGASSPVLPCRNAVLASVAAAHAAEVGADRVVIGSCADDHADFPDCRPECVEALSRATELAVGVRVVAPLVRETKSAAIRWAHARPEVWGALGASWSCYTPQNAGARAPIPCGECLACRTRRSAFEAAGFDDPAGR